MCAGLYSSLCLSLSSFYGKGNNGPHFLQSQRLFRFSGTCTAGALWTCGHHRQNKLVELWTSTVTLVKKKNVHYVGPCAENIHAALIAFIQ